MTLRIDVHELRARIEARLRAEAERRAALIARGVLLLDVVRRRRRPAGGKSGPALLPFRRKVEKGVRPRTPDEV